MTQCVNVPLGASGSSMMSAKLCACSGISENVSGGLTFWPSQVYFSGMLSPCWKAVLVITMKLLRLSYRITINVQELSGLLIISLFCRFLGVGFKRLRDNCYGDFAAFFEFAYFTVNLHWYGFKCGEAVFGGRE